MTALPSTRPYLIRALHEWCMDNGFTPYLAVAVDEGVRVPMAHVVNGEIVLNVSTEATGALVLGNEFIEFKARFGGVPQDISVPVNRVLAIYARENGQGMAFPVEFSEADGRAAAPKLGGANGDARPHLPGLALVDASEGVAEDPNGSPSPPPKSVGKNGKSKPVLKRIK